MVYHFCTSQGWRAGPALASSVWLQRWGGAEEEENERRCHRTAKRLQKILFYYPTTWVLTWIIAVPQNCVEDPQKSCFLSNLSFDMDTCSASGRHNVVVVWRGVQGLWDRAQVWKYIKKNWYKKRPGSGLKIYKKKELINNIARIANAVQVTICLLVSTSVY